MKQLGKLIYWITSITPKFKWLILQTYPTFDDNMLEIERIAKEFPLKKIIFLIPTNVIPENKFNFSNKTIFIKRRSFKGIIYYIFSKYVFITHGLFFYKFPKNQISVNVWHGMPLKKLGVQKGKNALLTTYTLCTSDFFKFNLSEAFKVPSQSIINCNLPRNFKLLNYSTANTFKREFKQNQKVIVWLPTYRSSFEGDIRVDGKDYGNVVNLPDFNIDVFINFLEEHNLVCYIKPHPMTKFEINVDSDSLMIINDNWLYKNGLTLDDLLAISDMLISDISSVLVDYLLLNKPITFCFSDIVEYSNSRGIYSDVLFNNLPGDFCEDYQGLIKSLVSFTNGSDNYEKNRILMRNLYHETQENTLLMELLTKIFKLT